MVALLALVCLSVGAYAENLESKIKTALNNNAVLGYSIHQETNGMSDELVNLANQKARAHKNYNAYWNATLVNFMDIEYADGLYAYMSERTRANVMLWSQKAIDVAGRNAAPELYVMRFLTKWHYHDLTAASFYPAESWEDLDAGGKTQLDVWVPAHRKEVRQMLAEFEAAERINARVAYSEIGAMAADLYAAMGKKQKANRVNRRVEAIQAEIEAAVNAENQRREQARQAATLQVKQNVAPKKQKKSSSSSFNWTDAVYYRGGGHF